MIEKALLIANTGDGPWCPVEDLEAVEVEGLEKGDTLHIINSEDNVLIRVQENGLHSMNILADRIRVLRAIGSSPVTVRAHCEA